ncbi:acyltransferase family protein [Flavobacterium macacae]|uniref:acyltransferase family protein n=1 Tax=Flavobacterium macacae TaxID=2488993 RepID=UPI0037430B59
MIFMILPEKNKIKISGQNIFSRLGIYTYGLYLTHTIVINLSIKLFEKLQLSLDQALNAALFFFATLSITILASILSFNLIEKPFLKAKKYFR